MENTNTLPPKETIYTGTNITSLSLKELYNNFMSNIIDIIKGLISGKGFNQVLEGENRMLYVGIFIIIVAVLLIPLAL